MRLIDADKIIFREIDEIGGEYEPYLGCSKSQIDSLPSVTPQEPRWIPVSERLPEPNANDGLIARYYLIQNEYEDMLVARYDGIGWEQIYQHEYLEDDVIAWMPLPEPYKAETEADNGNNNH